MLRASDKVGPYTLIKKLGAGGFGVVWLAEKRTIFATHKVALKIAHEDKINLEAIKREASLWEQANNHANVLPIFDADVYDGETVVIASQYAPDGSLEEWLSAHGGQAPSIEVAVEIANGILAGLEHLHSLNIIHRDLKPANILLQGETPRLADFGLARLLKSGSHSMERSGTFPYMAPEAFDGERSEQTDVWSAGAVFYQLLAGRLPFPQTDIVSLVGAITRYDPAPLPSSVPQPLQKIIARALQKQPAQRYESAAEMRAALRDAQRTLLLDNSHLQPSLVVNSPLGKTSEEEPAGIEPTLAAPSTEGQSLPPTVATPPAEREDSSVQQSIGGVSSVAPVQESNATVASISTLSPAPSTVPPPRRRSATPVHPGRRSKQLVWVGGVAALLLVGVIIALTSNRNAKTLDAQPTATPPKESSTPQPPDAETVNGKRDWAATEAAYRHGLETFGYSPIYQEGLINALMRQRKYKEMAAAAREAISLDPNNPKWHNYLGMALSQDLNLKAGDKEWSQAERLARQALQSEANKAESQKELGRSLFGLRKFPEAEKAYREAIRLNPDEDQVHHWLATALMNQEKYAEAEAEFREALRREPGDALINNNLATALIYQRKYAEAETLLREAVETEPTIGVYHFDLGIALADQGKYFEGEDEIRKAIYLEPTNETYKRNLKEVEAAKNKAIDAANKEAAQKRADKGVPKP
jgi:serine/threonine-protein kinase